MISHAKSRAPRQRFVGESGNQARRDPRPRRLVRLRPHGGRAAAVRTRSRRCGRDPCERATCLARRSGAGHRASPRVLPRRTQDRGHRRRPLDPRQHRADAAGAHGPVAQAHGQRTQRAHRPARAPARHPRRESRRADRRAFRRQPAEMPDRARAGHESPPADPRRAHARHRRGGQAGDHEPAHAAGRAGHGAAVHLRGSRRTAARVDANRRDARSPPGRQPAGRQHRRRGVCADRRARRSGSGSRRRDPQTARAAAVLALRHAGVADRAQCQS